jgi:hypothetical protein
LKKIIILGIFSLILTNCGTPINAIRIVKFSQKSDEITTTESLKKYLKSNKKPKIVLRTNSRVMSENITEQEKNNYLFSTIENQFLKSGFIVRDRQLFEKIVANSENNSNYESLKIKSDTDLIIELTSLDRDIEFKTNKYYDKGGVEKNSSYLANYTFYGATIEFKIIMIESNEFAGIYKFNYVPCVEGCDYSPSVRNKNREKNKLNSFEEVEEDKLVEFVKIATKQLINEMKN